MGIYKNVKNTSENIVYVYIERNNMPKTEIVKLIEWLRAHGHSDSEIIDCIEFVESNEKYPEGDR